MKYIETLLEELKKLVASVVSRLDGLEKKLDRLNRIKEAMEGDKLLDNQDLCLLLGITKRSLAFPGMIPRRRPGFPSAAFQLQPRFPPGLQGS
ncbi:hypothetical protein FACS1894179_03610 [Bacteroidia bacterium]|nr:hypothetical protein FACS1894179_03610 [Bacteroidia bacterium]